MTMILGGTNPAVTFPDGTIQNTSAVVGSSVPYSVLPTGSVLQVVQGTFTSTFSTSSTSFVCTGLTATITPKFSTSKILVQMSGSQQQITGNASVLTIYRNATNISPNSSNGFSVMYTGSTGVLGSCGIVYLDSPATTSATTYTIYFRVSGGSAALFGDGNGAGIITLMEIAG